MPPRCMPSAYCTHPQKVDGICFDKRRRKGDNSTPERSLYTRRSAPVVLVSELQRSPVSAAKTLANWPVGRSGDGMRLLPLSAAAAAGFPHPDPEKKIWLGLRISDLYERSFRTSLKSKDAPLIEEGPLRIGYCDSLLLQHRSERSLATACCSLKKISTATDLMVILLL
jgi:hypothetical protein